MTTFEEPATIGRDRYGRPLVIPPGGGKPVPYTRCTTYIGALEDTYNLGRWQQRMVAVGLADRPDLLLSVAAHREDKDALNRLCDQAREAAQASKGATTGTALHKLTERVDRGESIGLLPEAAAADVAAYIRATSEFECVAIEQFRVLDDLKIGGTPDRIVKYQGRYYIADLKTGSIDWSAQKMAMQLAVYSRSVAYDPLTGVRSALPDPIDRERGIVIHLPAGEAACSPYWVDIAAGWEAVQLATQVREWRKRKRLLDPMPHHSSGLDLAPLEAKILAATTVGELHNIWHAAVRDGLWRDELLALCQRRKAEINGPANR